MQNDIPQNMCGFTMEDVMDWLEEVEGPQPILYKDGTLYLQYPGWSINLYGDGTYAIEVTEGG